MRHYTIDIIDTEASGSAARVKGEVTFDDGHTIEYTAHSVEQVMSYIANDPEMDRKVDVDSAIRIGADYLDSYQQMGGYTDDWAIVLDVQAFYPGGWNAFVTFLRSR